MCKSCGKTLLNCICLQEDKEVKGQEVASVLTYKAAMEYETETHTHTVVFRGVSPMPFRMNALWCQRSSLCAHTDKTIEKERAKGKNDLARGDICRKKRQKSFY